MTNAPFIPAPHAEADSTARSAALRACLEELLARMVAASDIVLLEVSCPLVLGDPVSARGMGGRSRAGSTLAVRAAVIPGTENLPAGTLCVAANDETVLDQARAWPAMISFLLDLELSRLAAESAARGALEIANRDPGTGLGNRRAWEHTLRTESVRARRSGRPLTLMVLDIDGLKAVNDARGHASGDALIARAAQALDGLRRATDEICRLGGDEFGIAAPDTDEEQARFLAVRVREGLKEVGVRVSLGYAVSDDGQEPHDLWAAADASMYDDKRSRRPSWDVLRLEAEQATARAIASMPRP